MSVLEISKQLAKKCRRPGTSETICTAEMQEPKGRDNNNNNLFCTTGRTV